MHCCRLGSRECRPRHYTQCDWTKKKEKETVHFHGSKITSQAFQRDSPSAKNLHFFKSLSHQKKQVEPWALKYNPQMSHTELHMNARAHKIHVVVVQCLSLDHVWIANVQHKFCAYTFCYWVDWVLNMSMQLVVQCQHASQEEEEKHQGKR